MSFSRVGRQKHSYPRTRVRQSNSHPLLQSQAETSDRRRCPKTILLQTTSRVAAEPHRYVDAHPELCLAVSITPDSPANIISPDR